MVMIDEPPKGRTLPEMFEDLAKQSDAAIALITPDDIGGLGMEGGAGLAPRARQNVWVEVGWVLGKTGSLAEPAAREEGS